MKLIAKKPSGSEFKTEFSIVLYEREHSDTPFVTWFEHNDTGERSCGHYLQTEEQALKDFGERN